MQPSPKYTRDANKSTYLPYFKRFPHQKFLSQEKKRYEEPPTAHPRRFFTEEKSDHDPDPPAYLKIYSNSSIKEPSPGKIRPRTSPPTQACCVTRTPRKLSGTPSTRWGSETRGSW